jgi:methyl-accepting chemotaxis protein
MNLNAHARARGNNEIGTLANYFNHMMRNVRALVLSITNQTTSLSKSMMETAAAIDQITASIKAVEEREANQQIRTAVEDITDSVRKNKEDIDLLMKAVQRFQT